MVAAIASAVSPTASCWGCCRGLGRADGQGRTSSRRCGILARDRRQEAAGNSISGGFALEQGFIFTAMILSAATVYLIERRFGLAALWCRAAAGLSATGLMHSYHLTPADAVGAFGVPAWKWVAGYLIMAAAFWISARPGGAKRQVIGACRRPASAHFGKYFSCDNPAASRLRRRARSTGISRTHPTACRTGYRCSEP